MIVNTWSRFEHLHLTVCMYIVFNREAETVQQLQCVSTFLVADRCLSCTGSGLSTLETDVTALNSFVRVNRYNVNDNPTCISWIRLKSGPSKLDQHNCV
jgi:hypothetical protein